LNKVFVEKYHWSEEEAKAAANFIIPMLEFSSQKRATASQMLQHEWLKD